MEHLRHYSTYIRLIGSALQAIPEVARQPVSHTPIPLFENISYRLFRFNQTSVAYDASKEEKLEALNKRKAAVEQRLKDKQ